MTEGMISEGSAGRTAQTAAKKSDGVDDSNNGKGKSNSDADREFANAEILETQKTRSDLLKWKLIAIATLGGAGLGMPSSPGPKGSYALYILALIPAVAVYVDTLCAHLNLRILAKNAYATRNLEKWKDTSPEAFCDEARNMDSQQPSPNKGNGEQGVQNEKKKISVFDLEDYALEFGTIWLSGILIVFAIKLMIPENLNWQSLLQLFLTAKLSDSFFPGIFLAAACGLSLHFSIKLEKEFNLRSEALLNLKESGPKT